MLGKITTIKGNCPVSVANQHLVIFLCYKKHIIWSLFGSFELDNSPVIVVKKKRSIITGDGLCINTLQQKLVTLKRGLLAG